MDALIMKPTPNKLRICLADDHAMIRAGLKMLVNAQADMEVIGEASDGRAAVAMVLNLKPDVIVLDVSMPELSGLQAAEELRRARTTTKILPLTRHADGGYLQQLLSAGASGYMLKQSAAEELIRAIRAIAAGGTYLDPAIAGKLIMNQQGRFTDRKSRKQSDLTERETEVLRMIAWGYSNKEIATRLTLSVKTVEAHKANAMRKLDLTSRIDIVRFAILQGWLQDT
jgi:two-component system, NarL family, response regulator NreC